MGIASRTRDVRPARSASGAVAVAAVVLALALTIGLVWLRGDVPYRALGLLPPPDVVRFATPLLRVVTDLLGALTVGGLLAACTVLPSGVRGGLSPHAFAAARRCGLTGLAWALGAGTQVVLQVANDTGQGLGVLAHAGFGGAMTALQEPVGWLVTGVLALTCGLVARSALSWRGAAAALALGAAALAPPVVTGRVASVGADHDIVTDAALLAAVAAVVWLGATVTTWAALRAGVPHRDVVVRRSLRLAVGAAVIVAVAGGLAGAWLLPTGPFDTTYGLDALIATAALLMALAGVVTTARAHQGVRGLAVQVGGLTLLVGTAAVSASDVPPGLLVPSTPQQVLLGFDLTAPPDLLRLLVDGRVNVLFDLGALVLAATYLLGVRRLRRRGDAWPPGRTAAWLVGCALLALATSSGLGRYAMAMFSAHMGMHMLLSMLAPILLVLGGPVTLALRALPAAGSERPDGAREWILALTSSRPARLLTHPLVALALFVGSFYVLYFSPIYAEALPFHWAHQLMNLHFVLVGYLFFWPIVGVDHAPTSLPHVARLGLLLASMPFHAFFGVALMSSDTVIGENFFREIALPWAPDLLADQSIGGGIAWASGELPLLVVLIALLVQWSRHEERAAARHDRHADRDGDAELDAWNTMLTEMARGRR